VTQNEHSLSGYAKPSAARMTVPAFPLTRILIITDAWLPVGSHLEVRNRYQGLGEGS
jgi:hypothetical protein